MGADDRQHERQGDRVVIRHLEHDARVASAWYGQARSDAAADNRRFVSTSSHPLSQRARPAPFPVMATELQTVTGVSPLTGHTPVYDAVVGRKLSAVRVRTNA